MLNQRIQLLSRKRIWYQIRGFDLLCYYFESEDSVVTKREREFAIPEGKFMPFCFQLEIIKKS
jgi:hypothetical protein